MWSEARCGEGIRNGVHGIGIGIGNGIETNPKIWGLSAPPPQDVVVARSCSFGERDHISGVAYLFAAQTLDMLDAGLHHCVVRSGPIRSEVEKFID
jgi:hypothetical protein